MKSEIPNSIPPGGGKTGPIFCRSPGRRAFPADPPPAFRTSPGILIYAAKVRYDFAKAFGTVRKASPDNRL